MGRLYVGAYFKRHSRIGVRRRNIAGVSGLPSRRRLVSFRAGAEGRYNGGINADIIQRINFYMPINQISRILPKRIVWMQKTMETYRGS